MTEEMPRNYDEPKMTSTNRQMSGPTVHIEYAKSRAGILKIVEIVLSLITFICSIVYFWFGHGWAEFVSISAFLSTTIYFILHLLNLVSRFPGPWLLIEFIYYVVFSLFYLIVAIVAAAKASTSPENVGATAFFAFAATAVYTVDTVFQFRAWSRGEAGMATHTTTTTASPSTTEQGRTLY